MNSLILDIADKIKTPENKVVESKEKKFILSLEEIEKEGR